MVIDVFTYNGEKDLLDIRLNVLYPYVDRFIILEAPTTFSGKTKPFHFNEHSHYFNEFLDKILYFPIDENYTEEEREVARISPNTGGPSHWEHEFLQKESVAKAIKYCNYDDLIFIGDVDEIWNPAILPLMVEMPEGLRCKLECLVYTYWLNNRSNEEFHGTLCGRYEDLQDEPINHYRSWPNLQARMKSNIHQCWHFTSIGGYDKLKQKLDDSYTEESYNTDWVKDNLEENIGNNKDFLGRDFEYWEDESEWPQYLTDNKEKYKHLCK